MKKITPHSLLGAFFLFLIAILLMFPLLFGVFKGIPQLPDAFKDPEVLFSLQLSIKTSLASTVICIPLALIATVFLYYSKIPAKATIKQLLTTPMSLPHIVLGIMILLFFGNQGIGPKLAPFGIDVVFTVQGILLAQVIINLPLVMEQIWAALSKIQDKEIFLAKSLGATGFNLERFIIYPSIKRDILAAVIMCFSRALGEYGAVMMVAGTTRMKTELLPTAILLNMSTGNMERALSIATILVLLAISLSFISKLFVKDVKDNASD